MDVDGGGAVLHISIESKQRRKSRYSMKNDPLSLSSSSSSSPPPAPVAPSPPAVPSVPAVPIVRRVPTAPSVPATSAVSAVSTVSAVPPISAISATHQTRTVPALAWPVSGARWPCPTCAICYVLVKPVRPSLMGRSRPVFSVNCTHRVAKSVHISGRKTAHNSGLKKRTHFRGRP